MTYAERAVTFGCGHESLVGILAVPQAPASTGVIVIVGGPQYRAGSHRQFVLLSRTLAKAGYAVLRFDYRGMGDSSGAQRDFTAVSRDIASAIQTLQQQLPAVRQVALWGLCDGASAALLYCQETQDARVSGLCLLNPWVRSEASLARAHVKHYYMDRLGQKEFWLKLLRGKVALAAVAGLWRNVRLMASTSEPLTAAQRLAFQQRMALAWGSFNGSILLVLSGDDYTAREFMEYARVDRAWSGLLQQAKVIVHPLPDADHTFSGAVSRAGVERATLNWLQQQAAA